MVQGPTRFIEFLGTSCVCQNEGGRRDDKFKLQKIRRFEVKNLSHRSLDVGLSKL